MKKKKISFTRKEWFEIAFSAIVVVLFLIKLIFHSDIEKQPSSPEPAPLAQAAAQKEEKKAAADAQTDSFKLFELRADSTLYSLPAEPKKLLGEKKHRIFSVSNYARAFPDANDVQLSAARHYGITPASNPKEVRKHSGLKLFNISYSPYYCVAELEHSQPLLIQRAQLLLSRIGRNFFDSLMVKQVSPALLIVTSVTRSEAEVARLQRRNVNAAQSSCHSYGTTFDISYVKYNPFPSKKKGEFLPLPREDSLKWVLSEVLDDLRRSGACFVKHEVKQGCFHITVR